MELLSDPLVMGSALVLAVVLALAVWQVAPPDEFEAARYRKEWLRRLREREAAHDARKETDSDLEDGD